MIDDIQFIANKERTQEEFFHTFNNLYTSQKQIILTSDSSPRNIPTLEERLRSRFEWGLIADIQPPDHRTKTAIIRRKAEFERLDLPEDLIEFIAIHVHSNIREIEGIINRLMIESYLTGQPITKEFGQESLKNILPPVKSKPTASTIIKVVARHFDLKVSEITSRSNSWPILRPRQVAMYLCRKLTSLSHGEIGHLFNNKHRAAVMFAVRRVEERRKEDPDLERDLLTLEQHFS
ncbi:MAG TPA: chromosomal replication initiator protein DnaA [Thermoanaerobaculia bacterium]|nr:chromosomal replication initiator protein DnaA [Thermoanaerobaculia bacterium]